MTREEAIWYLQPIADSASLPRYAEALNMAISALKYGGPKYVLLSQPPEDAQTIDTGVPMTNADHIRSMTDEELAVFLGKTISGCMRITPMCEVEDTCEGCFEDWLKQPYKEDA